MTTSNQSPKRSRRRGFLGSIELVLILPILFVVVLASVEFSLLFFARGDVLAASRAGARLACQPGIHPEDVRSRVLDVLEPRFRNVADVYVETATFPGEIVTVAVRVPMKSATPDLLWPIGIGLGGRDLHAATKMIRE